ncbi:MAG: diguanylate cyclase [Deltaproteobacteria bacterium]|nr:diguanylate cyclase [Deltaproteobacteria bacterium]
MSDSRWRRTAKDGARPEAFVRQKKDSSLPRTGREIGTSLIGRVLILDEDSGAASELAEALTRDGHEVELRQQLSDVDAAVRIAPDVVVVDPWSGDEPGEPILDALRRVHDPTGASPEVVVVTALHDVHAAVECLHRGASDYIVKPTTPGRLRLAIARAFERLRLLKDNGRLRRDLALFAAAQRILETLDSGKLAGYGLEALCSFTGATGGALFDGGAALAEQDLSAVELQQLAALKRPEAFTERIALGNDGAGRFSEALALELDDDRRAVLASVHPFDAAAEETALFLARQLQTAFRNTVRFADAEREARRDSLTGLWNAKAFHEATRQLIERAVTTPAPFSVLFLDLDHFKAVNDRHGHVAGSRLLVEVAQLLERCVREGDLLARFGGDEFTVLLPEIGTDTAKSVADRIRETIARHRFRAPSGEALPVTVCIGVATFPVHAGDTDGILDMADRAMYLGKGSTRNSVHVAMTPASDPRATPKPT